MIATVTLNPAVDIRLALPNFHVNGVFRCADSQRTAGGKGLNVTRVLRILGNHVLATGFLGGMNGQFIRQELEKIGVDHQFIPIRGETRNCFAIITDAPSHTEILENGPVIMEEELTSFQTAFEQMLTQVEWIVASGSLPQGIDSSLYKWMGERTRAKGKNFILDTSGETLVRGIEACPFLIKPNKEELEAIFQQTMENTEQIIDHARKLCNQGAENVIVSLGADGAVWVSQSLVLEARIPSIDALNPVGSGDSMVAGCLHRLAMSDTIEESFRYGCAAGMANALEKETGKINPKTLDELLREIAVNER